MIKIPTLFKRGSRADGYKVMPELTPGCEWVRDSKAGFITIKVDGLNVRVIEKDNIKILQKRMKPADGYNEAAYMSCDPDSPMDEALFECFNAMPDPRPGIYEAFGPKIQGNRMGCELHGMILIAPVDGALIINPNATKISRGLGASDKTLYDTIYEELVASPEIEGLVFQMEEPSMVLKAAAKIKRVDFGLQWPIKPIATKLCAWQEHQIPMDSPADYECPECLEIYYKEIGVDPNSVQKCSFGHMYGKMLTACPKCLEGLAV